jgi:integrase/recombinase XerD
MLYLDLGQVSNILRTAYKSSRRDHLLLLLTWTHGLRRGETATLKLRDMAGNFIRVARLKNSLPTIHPLRETHDLLFNEKMALSAWLEERKATNDFLFPSRDKSGHINLGSVSNLAARYMALAGVPEPLRHTHALKHSCCAIQARAGAKIENIAAYVGHVDIKNTRIYLNVSSEESATSAFAAFDRVRS